MWTIPSQVAQIELMRLRLPCCNIWTAAVIKPNLGINGGQSGNRQRTLQTQCHIHSCQLQSMIFRKAAVYDASTTPKQTYVSLAAISYSLRYGLRASVGQQIYASDLTSFVHYASLKTHDVVFPTMNKFRVTDDSRKTTKTLCTSKQETMLLNVNM